MATQKVYCSYQEIIDLHTESDNVSVIGLHTPIGDVPKQMFRGFYHQFKKMKYLGASIAMVPAARLPADPLQVSYEAGEPTIDPRDMLNPIMFHGCCGNDMGAILNTMYGSATNWGTGLYGAGADHFNGADMRNFPSSEGTSIIQSLYYKALTDNTWQKAHPQRGFRKNGLRPLVHTLAANTQLMPSSVGASQSQTLAGNSGMIAPSTVEYVSGNPTQNFNSTLGPTFVTPSGTSSPSGNAGAGISNQSANLRVAPRPIGVSGSTSGAPWTPQYSADPTAFFTNKKVPLGWIDTYQPSANILEYTSRTTANYGSSVNAMAAAYGSTWDIATLPLLYMGMILLPPAYKTEQYFRLVINHRFAFKDFRGISMQSSDVVETLEVPSYFNNNGDGVQVYHADSGNNIINPLSLDPEQGVKVDVGVYGTNTVSEPEPELFDDDVVTE